MSLRSAIFLWQVPNLLRRRWWVWACTKTHSFLFHAVFCVEKFGFEMNKFISNVYYVEPLSNGFPVKKHTKRSAQTRQWKRKSDVNLYIYPMPHTRHITENLIVSKLRDKNSPSPGPIRYLDRPLSWAQDMARLLSVMCELRAKFIKCRNSFYMIIIKKCTLKKNDDEIENETRESEVK